MKRPKVKFSPRARKDGRWAIEIFNVDKNFSCGFLQWIETTDGTCCRVSNHEVARSFYSKEETEELCAQLDEMYAKGEIS